MPINNLILDFDGTLTDSHIEAAGAIKKWNELLALDLGMPLAELEREISRYTDVVKADPAAGWTNGGYVVAPAIVDPYVFHTSVLQYIIATAKPLTGSFTVTDRDKWMDTIFFQSYPHATTAFRPGAREFLLHARDAYDVLIVTNSKTDAVQRKLGELQVDGVAVAGQARKYVIDPQFELVPESVTHPGFPRPVLLRRRNYHQILSQFDPATTAVVGDIYELDHALPEHMGFRTIQIETPGTPGYERLRHTNGAPTAFARTYDEVLRHLRK